MCIKSDFEDIILKLATYGQREKAFLLSSKFCPQWIVCSCPGLYTYGETIKNVDKIGLQSNFFFKPATNGQSDKGFLLTSKVCPQGIVCPCPGPICIYKIIKNVYKIRFLFLKLATNGQNDKGFLLTSNVCPQVVVCPCPGTICVYKIIKYVYKIRSRRDYFELATNGKREKAFLLHKTFVPNGLSAPAWGYTHVKNTHKKR